MCNSECVHRCEVKLTFLHFLQNEWKLELCGGIKKNSGLVIQQKYCWENGKAFDTKKSQGLIYIEMDQSNK